MQKITSRDNSRLKLARNVLDGRDDNLVFVEGTRLAREVLRSGQNVRLCLVAARKTASDSIVEIVSALESNGCECLEVPDRLFDQMADTSNSQGLALLCDRPKATLPEFETRLSGRISLLLNEVNNPANLGATLRSAEAFDVRNVIVTRKSADVFGTKSIRGSMGAAMRLNIWSDASFEDAVEWARSREITIRAADISGRKTPAELDWSRSAMIVFGSEAHGLSENQLAACDELFSIKMSNDVESLNLGVAAGIILYEATRTT
jgi:TrmH family RNA methyltransferase